MLSWTEGIPIAFLPDKDKLLFYSENLNTKKAIKSDDIEVCSDIIFQQKNRLSLRRIEIDSLVEAVTKRNDIKLNEKLKKYYDLCLDRIDKMTGRIIHLEDGNFEPIPIRINNQNDRIFITGPSGSGKSTWVSKYAINYQDLYPERPIFLFSRKEEDPVLDDIDNLRRIVINEEFNEDPLTLEELQDSLCIFDDLDTLKDEAILKSVYKLRNDLLETGRSKNVDILITSHIVFNHKKTSHMILESNSFVIFKQTAQHHIKKYLREVHGFDLQDIEKILGLPSRWVQIHTSAPRFVLWETGSMLL